MTPHIMNPSRFTAGGVGGWVELGRTTLGSAATTIEVSSLADKRYYMVLANTLQNGVHDLKARINSDTGSNYAYREQIQGAPDTTNTSKTFYNLTGDANSTDSFYVAYAGNLSSQEKLVIGHFANVRVAGAGTPPHRTELVAKHVQTSNPIDAFSVFDTVGSNKLATGSEVVVLGWDPADTHTTNFWEELGTDSGDGSSTDITVTFTAKKIFMDSSIY